MSFIFNPSVHIFALPDGRAAVVFDSGCDIDQNRATITHCLDPFKQLATDVAGFDVAPSAEASGAATVDGKVVLKIADAAGHERQVELASCALAIGFPTGKQKATEADVATALADIRDEVRQAVAGAFTTALLAYYGTIEQRANGTAPNVAAVAGGIPHVATEGRGRSVPVTMPKQRAANDGRSEYMPYLKALAIGPIVVFGLWGATRLFSAEPAPVQPVVSQALAHDPDSVNASIELTKQTLREMGLDPGDGAADLGCLVQSP